MLEDDSVTDGPDSIKRRGRPKTGKAMTSAEQKALSRQRLKAEGKVSLSLNVSIEVREAIRNHVKFKDEDQNELVDRVMRAYLLRKR